MNLYWFVSKKLFYYTCHKTKAIYTAYLSLGEHSEMNWFILHYFREGKWVSEEGIVFLKVT